MPFALRFRLGLAGALVVGFAVAGGPARAEEAQAAPSPTEEGDLRALPPATGMPWPSKVSAVYKITFNGFDIGDFKFNSSVQGSSYTLTGNAGISALLGAFTWTGVTRSAGAVAGDTPKPAGYTFDFRTGSNTGGSIKMGFAEGGVNSVQAIPPASHAPGVVPVQQHHLKNVLDPLSAVMALSRGKGTNPCGRRLAVFDGKQRFDLLLSFRRQARINEVRPSGQPGIVYICRVRYIPIAGHRNNDDTRHMASSGGIEVSLRPVPSANLLVPYQITVPTAAGTAVLTSQRVDIMTPGRRQIALVH